MTDQIESIKIMQPDKLYVFEVKLKKSKRYSSTFSITANRFPTGNCQMFIIKNFGSLFEGEFNDDNIIYLLHYIFDNVPKSFVLIDIKEIVYNKLSVIERFQNEFNYIINTPYISTNASPMRIVGFSRKLKQI